MSWVEQLKITKFPKSRTCIVEGCDRVKKIGNRCEEHEEIRRRSTQQNFNASIRLINNIAKDYEVYFHDIVKLLRDNLNSGIWSINKSVKCDFKEVTLKDRNEALKLFTTIAHKHNITTMDLSKLVQEKLQKKEWKIKKYESISTVEEYIEYLENTIKDKNVRDLCLQSFLDGRNFSKHRLKK